jgi:hypothetical protein
MEKRQSMIRCVTTMNKEYYDGIGKVMVHTWLECFSNDYKLHLYLEDFTLDIQDDRVVIEDWNAVKDLYQIWSDTRFSANNRHQKFTLKALSQIAHWKKYSGNMLWLDADMMFIKRIEKDVFEKVLEGYPLASWGQDQFESGTVFVNIDHSDFQKIKETYESIYIGPMGIPEGEKWFDGELLGWACKHAGSKHKNLWCYCTAKTSTPLNRSWVGDYMRHFKAKQKNTLKQTLIDEFNRPDLVALFEV